MPATAGPMISAAAISWDPSGATAASLPPRGTGRGGGAALTARPGADRLTRAVPAIARRRHVRDIPQAVQRPRRQAQLALRLGGKPAGPGQVTATGGRGGISERGRGPGECVSGDHLVYG
jgi:hypothetical protein